MAAALGAIGLFYFDKRLRTFWIICITWGCACLVADIAITPPGTGHLPFVINVVADLNFGSVAGGIYIWAADALVRLFCRKAEPLRATALFHPPQLIVDFKAMATGYLAITLLGLFWVSASFVPVLMALTTVALDHRFIQLLHGLGYQDSRLFAIADYFSMLAPLALYLLFLFGIRRSAHSVLNGHSRASLLFPALVALVVPFIDKLTPGEHKQTISTFSTWAASGPILLCAIGLFLNSLRVRPLQAAIPSLFTFWRKFVRRVAEKASLSGILCEGS